MAWLASVSVFEVPRLTAITPLIAVSQAASFDVWAFGVLLLELCSGADLFHKDCVQIRHSAAVLALSPSSLHLGSG